MADVGRRGRVMALVIGKIGHMGYEVFAGGVNEGIASVKS